MVPSKNYLKQKAQGNVWTKAGANISVKNTRFYI